MADDAQVAFDSPTAFDTWAPLDGTIVTVRRVAAQARTTAVAAQARTTRVEAQ